MKKSILLFIIIFVFFASILAHSRTSENKGTLRQRIEVIEQRIDNISMRLNIIEEKILLQHNKIDLVKSNSENNNQDDNNITVEVSNIKMLYDDAGALACHFDLIINNQTNYAHTIYAFVWAQNDYVIPPARGLWPAEAILKNLSPRGQFVLNSFTDGCKLNLRSKQIIIEKDTGIWMPYNIEKGKYLASRFTEMRLLLYSEKGVKIYDKTIQLK